MQQNYTVQQSSYGNQQSYGNQPVIRYGNQQQPAIRYNSPTRFKAGGPNTGGGRGCFCCGCDCCSICWMILWLLVLILFAWPIALILVILYVILLPWKACCTCCVPIVDGVYQGVLLPLTCAENAVSGKPMCNCC